MSLILIGPVQARPRCGTKFVEIQGVTPPQPSTRHLRVLVVDDEPNIRATLRMCLEGLGCVAREAASGEAAAEAVRIEPIDLVFLDLRLGQEDGLEVLPRLMGERPGLDVVVMTAYATIDTAVQSIQRGARDYLAKPFTPAQIRHVVNRVIEREALEGRLLELEASLRESVPEADLGSAAPAMRSVLEVVSKVAKHDVSVLLRGENGTGKGVLARAIHAQSPRSSRPFVVVNCPTLTEGLLASELFGHARGAFTGAVRDQAGRVEAAEGGTLFLDEIAEITPALQAKLLRFIQEKRFERVGESLTRSAEVRILAATNRDLEAEVKAGRFREDLLFRLDVVEIRVPPLRERLEDIPRLARLFLSFFSRTVGRPVLDLTSSAEEMLLGYSWPGNVREMRNAMERAVLLSSGQVLDAEALPERIVAHATRAPTVGGDFSLEDVEREHLLRVLARAPNLEDAARILCIDTSTLWRKRKKYGR